jgi:hypothetical protein
VANPNLTTFPGDGSAPQRGVGVKQSFFGLAKMDPNNMEHFVKSA